tara:strand:+ start:627 stop:758 length:132 start_codon:yes stop_codon:yes gene_type:complete
MLAIAPDANIVVSSLITPTGKPARIMDAWKRDELPLITSTRDY